MESLGVNLGAKAGTMIRAIRRCGIGYFHAPSHHPIFSKIQPLRRKLRVRTIFNLLGPLSNPLILSNQLVGVAERELIPIYSQVLKNLGIRAALVFHSEDGLDEISVCARTRMAHILKGKKIRFFRLDPSQYGFRRGQKLLKGGDLRKNRRLALRLLQGRLKGSLREMAVLNAAAGLWVSGKAENLRQGIAKAEHSIDSGRAHEALLKLVQISQTG